MKLLSQPTSSGKTAIASRRRIASEAFTLLELLMVVTIIGIIAVLAIPSISNLGSGDKVTVGGRQLVDDLNLARAKAIATRSTVYVVFLPTNLHTINLIYTTNQTDHRTITNNLIGKTYTGYALYSERSAGDQPGVTTPRYLSDWKELPAGLFILPEEFDTNSALCSFSYGRFPFPTATSATPFNVVFPYIAFNAYGQLIGGKDLELSLGEGSVARPRDPANENSFYLGESFPRVNLIDGTNALGYTNYVYVNWLTGRGKVKRPEIQ